jgi:hypothetical protein
VTFSNDANFLFVTIETDEANPLVFTSVNVGASPAPTADLTLFPIVTQNDGEKYAWDGSDCAPDPLEFGVASGEFLHERHDNLEDSVKISHFRYSIPLSDITLSQESGCSLTIMVYVEAEAQDENGDARVAKLWIADRDLIELPESCAPEHVFGYGEFTLCGLPQCEAEGSP